MKKVFFAIGLILVLASCAAPVKEEVIAVDSVETVAVDTTKVVEVSVGATGVTVADTTKK